MTVHDLIKLLNDIPIKDKDKEIYTEGPTATCPTLARYAIVKNGDAFTQGKVIIR